MKLVCDCGEELNFIVKEDEEDYEEETGHFVVKKGNIDIVTEHDQAWIKCKKCGHAIWMFT